jgi:nucleoside-diphosphate-sugar epimerase
MKALVTGASGFIGSHVVEALEAQGHQVFALVRPTSNTAHLKRTRAQMVVGDVTDRDSLVRACRGMDWVFHAAAVLETSAGWRHYYEVGVQGTRFVVEAAEQNQVSRLIHLSTICVYGMKLHAQVCTENTPLERHPPSWNHYVREKVLSEQLVMDAHRAGRVCATVVRPSLVIGPRDRTIIPRLLRVTRSPLPSILGDGNNRVPLVVVEELAAACVKAAQTKQAEGKCYNLSGREIVRQIDITTMLTEVTGIRMPRVKIPYRSALVSAAIIETLWKFARAKGEPISTRILVATGGADWEIDCSRARQDLGWVGDSDYKMAIQRYVAALG